MYHNTVEFWQQVSLLPPDHPDTPAPRICRLLLRLFERWKTKPLWLNEQDTGHLFDGKSAKEKKALAQLPIAIRKGMAIARMLDVVTTPEIGTRAGTYCIDADELIVGCLPPYSVGQGKEFVEYLTDDERIQGALSFLNERSPASHIVPNHGVVLDLGINGLIEKCKELEAAAIEKKAQDFYKSVILALDGVLLYASRFADLAETTAAQFTGADQLSQERRENMLAVAKRLRIVPANPPTTFLEAVQSIFLMHCALHNTIEIVPLGRLDQLLDRFYSRDIAEGILTEAQTQEIIDCLWVKLDEMAILNNRHAEDRFTLSDTVVTVTRGGSNFDRGGLLNQWMQQITIGGIKATNNQKPQDASNKVTMLCLEAARRLPLNSPTLDLRLHKNSPKPVIVAAARAILSGGAHPVLLNDDRIVPALHQGTGGTVELKSARNYACDGCYETLFAGETEFGFGFVPAPGLLEKSLNRGGFFGTAGPVHLRGMNDGWRTALPEDIKSLEQLWGIIEYQMSLDCHRFINATISSFGDRESVCPSPLLSALINGCLETGRDLSGGGARYHLFSPLMTGISTFADSLYAIKRLVFDEQKFTISELVSCLRSNWGENDIVIGEYVTKERISEIRKLSMSLPKFGQGVTEIDGIAWQLIEAFNSAIKGALNHPIHREKLQRLSGHYDHPDQKFEILIAPGVGTFEQYVFGGGFVGASPDGRKSGKPMASDFSPAPIHPDQDATVQVGDEVRHARRVPLTDGLRSYNHDSINYLCDGAPADFNIREDFPEDDLVAAIEIFAQGKSSNVLTFTVANPETFIKAQEKPEECDLLRVRMGGWTEFFIALFPDHQSQHRRRPLYVSAKEAAQ